VVSGACGDAQGRLDLRTRAVRWQHDGLHRILGHDPALLRLDLDDLPHLAFAEDADLLLGAVERMANGNPVELEVRLLDGAGRPRWVRLTAARNRSANALALGVEDVQERRARLDAEAERHRSRGLETLAAGLAHEFNNLLTPVRGYVEMALMALVGEHPSAPGLRTALAQVDRCAELVEVIQHCGRKAVLHRRRTDLASLAGTTLRLARPATPARRPVEFRMQAAEVLPDVWVDQASVRMALLHLLRNAAEALPEGGVVHVAVDPLVDGGEEDVDFVRLSVRDEGVGIRPEELAFIFDPFFTTHGRSEARGLGLSMVQGVADQHGGWVRAQSQPGRGTEIEMFLPTWQEAHDHAPLTVRSGAGRRAVVLEVGKALRLLVGKVLDGEGWRTAEADSLAEAHAALSGLRAGCDLLVVGSSALPGAGEARALRAAAGARARLLLLHADPRRPEWAGLAGDCQVRFLGPAFSPRSLAAALRSWWAEPA
jgi:signal transduction histidine kinase